MSGTRRSYSSWLCGLAGLVAGVVVMAMLPAIAATGDVAVMGEWNRAGKQTVFTAGSAVTLQVRNTKATGIPLRLIGDAGMPPMEVTSGVMVENLNADLLDGMDASAFAADTHGHAWSDLTSGIPAGLSDGDDDTIYTDGEAVAAVLAADGAGSGLDADLLDGSDSSDFASSDQRCPYGWTAAGFDADGGIQCGGMVTVDEAGGDDPSMVLDASGYPVIAYGAADNLRLARCHDPYCISFTVNTVDTDPLTHRFASLALDASGYPVIAYYDDTIHELKLAHCVDATCEAAASIEVVDSDGDVGAYNSMVLDASGYPVISYTDYANFNLKVAHCDDADCTSASIETAATGQFTGEYTSIALDGSGYPIVAFYQDQIGAELRLAHCSDADCAGTVSIQVVDTDGIAGKEASMVLDGSGYPVIAYRQDTNDDLRVAHCDDSDCTSASVETVASEDNTGLYPSVALGPNGNPMVAYRDATDDVLELAVCGDADCTSATLYTIDTRSEGGVGSAMVVRNGFPIVAHHAHTADDLVLVFP